MFAIYGKAENEFETILQPNRYKLLLAEPLRASLVCRVTFSEGACIASIVPKIMKHSTVLCPLSSWTQTKAMKPVYSVATSDGAGRRRRKIHASKSLIDQSSR